MSCATCQKDTQRISHNPKSSFLHVRLSLISNCSYAGLLATTRTRTGGQMGEKSNYSNRTNLFWAYELPDLDLHAVDLASNQKPNSNKLIANFISHPTVHQSQAFGCKQQACRLELSLQTPFSHLPAVCTCPPFQTAPSILAIKLASSLSSLPVP